MQLVTLGPTDFHGRLRELRRELEAARSRMNGPVGVAIVYVPHGSPAQEVIATVRQVVEAPVVGATTGGAAFTERGASRTGVVVGLLAVDAHIAVARHLSHHPVETMKSAITSLELGRGRFTSVLVLADAFATDGENIVRALREASPPHCRAFGGTAGDDWTFKGTRVFADGEELADAAIFVALRPELRLHSEVRHGWCIADGAKRLEISEIEGNVLKRLGGRPAVEVYAEELRRLGFLKQGEEPSPQVLATYELGSPTVFHERLKIRAPLAIRPDGAIVLASSLRQGDHVRVVVTDSARLIEAASELSRQVVASAGGKLGGALVFDCAARLQLLGADYAKHAEAFHCRAYPTLGMACYGEVARFGGSMEGFHNTTAVMVGW